MASVVKFLFVVRKVSIFSYLGKEKALQVKYRYAAVLFRPILFGKNAVPMVLIKTGSILVVTATLPF